MRNGTGEDPIQRSTRNALERAEYERIKLADDREKHLAAEQARAEMKTAELLGLLSEVPADLAIRIRLEAMLSVLHRPDLNGSQKQLIMDERALELARYAIRGVV